MRLAEALAALDAKAFERLCRRRGVHIDERKRLSPAEQAARQLADWALRAPLAVLPEPARAAALHLATHGAGADRRELGGGVLPLIELDLVFGIPGQPGRVAMPAAFRVQLPPSPGEDRGSARALLATQDEAVSALLGKQLLGRLPVGPAPLWLGRVLERLESPADLESLLSELSPKQRRLLEAVEARGGQLETDELLELERSPVRVKMAGGAVLPTRSASYQLHVRGLLLARARGLWAVPAEVAERVGGPRRAQERKARRELLEDVARDEDLSPARAALSDDPGPAAVALLASLSARGALPGGDRAVRRSVLGAVAGEQGLGKEQAELLVAVARGAGARLRQAELRDAGALLFRVWRSGGAWDEARADPDVHRAGEELARVPTPTKGLREVLLELLEAMPEERFAPVDEVSRTASRDLRNAGAPRLLERARRRDPERFLGDPVAVARRIALASLPALGAVDLGRVDGRDVIRLSRRARRWMAGDRGGGPGGSLWEGGGRLRVGGGARVDAVLRAAGAAHAIVSAGVLTLRVDEASAARGLDLAGVDELRERFEALAAPLDPAAARALRHSARERSRVPYVAVSAYLPVEDEGLRQRILADPEMRELLIPGPPDAGFLVRAGVSEARLIRALAKLGIVLDRD